MKTASAYTLTCSLLGSETETSERAALHLEARYRKSRSVASTSSTPGFSTLMTTSFLLSLSTAAHSSRVHARIFAKNAYFRDAYFRDTAWQVTIMPFCVRMPMLIGCKEGCITHDKTHTLQAKQLVMLSSCAQGTQEHFRGACSSAWHAAQREGFSDQTLTAVKYRKWGQVGQLTCTVHLCHRGAGQGDRIH